MSGCGVVNSAVWMVRRELCFDRCGSFESIVRIALDPLNTNTGSDGHSLRSSDKRSEIFEVGSVSCFRVILMTIN